MSNVCVCGGGGGGGRIQYCIYVLFLKFYVHADHTSHCVLTLVDEILIAIEMTIITIIIIMRNLFLYMQ